MCAPNLLLIPIDNPVTTLIYYPCSAMRLALRETPLHSKSFFPGDFLIYQLLRRTFSCPAS